MNVLLSFLITMAASSAAVEKVIEPQKYILCKNRSIVRTIRIEADGEGCQAKYTKAGVDRTIGHGSYPNSCNRFVDNVKANLENANWKCRSVNEAKITAQAPDSNE